MPRATLSISSIVDASDIPLSITGYLVDQIQNMQQYFCKSLRK
jgi:hypothetical protein